MLTRAAGLASKANRQAVFKAGLKPTITENPRHRQKPKRGRKRLFAAALYTRRFTGEGTRAWADKCKRLLLRFETQPQPHLGFKLLAFTLLNLRAFCGG